MLWAIIIKLKKINSRYTKGASTYGHGEGIVVIIETKIEFRILRHVVIRYYSIGDNTNVIWYGNNSILLRSHCIGIGVGIHIPSYRDIIVQQMGNTGLKKQFDRLNYRPFI